MNRRLPVPKRHWPQGWGIPCVDSEGKVTCFAAEFYYAIHELRRGVLGAIRGSANRPVQKKRRRIPWVEAVLSRSRVERRMLRRQKHSRRGGDDGW